MEQWRKAKKHCVKSKRIESRYLILKNMGPTLTKKELSAVEYYNGLVAILRRGRQSGKSFRMMANELKKKGVKICKSRLHQIWQEI